jgi:hypothetical protein
MEAKEKMSGLMVMEKKRDLLQKKLDLDLLAENAMKLQINREFEELKHLEVLLERLLERKRSAEQLEIRH